MTRREEKYPDGTDNRFYVYVTKGSLGYTLTLQGRFAEAKDLLLDAHWKFDPPNMTSDKQRVKREIVQWIVIMYDEWNRLEPRREHAEQADEWRKKLDGLPAIKSDTRRQEGEGP